MKTQTEPKTEKQSAAHTPGPWRVMQRAFEATICANGAIAALGGKVRAINTVEEAEEMQANARLIAAAPELLLKLTELANICSYMTGAGKKRDIDWRMLAGEARAVIAKATGGAK